MKEEERIEGARWLQEYFKIRDLVGLLLTKVSQAENKSSSERLIVFLEVM